MSTFSKDDGVIRYRSGLLRSVLALFAAFASPPAFMGPFMFKHANTLACIALPVTYLLLIALGSAAWHFKWYERSARLRADRTGLWINGRCAWRRESIRQAYTVKNERGVFLRLVRKSAFLRSVDIAVADEDEAEVLLAALELDAAHTVADYEVTAGTQWSMWKRLALVLLSFIGALGINAAILLHGVSETAATRYFAFLITTPLIGVFAFVALALASPHTLRVSVGADGVRIHRRGFIGTKTTFHPYSTIEGASTDGHDTQLRLTDGTVIDMHQASSGTAVADHELEVRGLVKRVEQQLAVARSAPAASAAAVARSGRSAEDWMKGAAALRESQATFRKPVIPADQLWSIVEDATATASERAGAALTLRHELDASDRDRLRIAAEACAAPKLRVALETIASTADDQGERELLEALAPLDQVEGRTMPMRTMSK